MSDENSATIIDQDDMAMHRSRAVDNENLRHETALESYSHEEFDKLVQEEESYSHEHFDKLVRLEDINQNREGNAKLSQESAFEKYNHKDFDNLVQDEKISENSIKLRAESAFKSYSHEDFDNLVQDEEASETNINLHAGSAFEKKDYDNLDQTEAHIIRNENFEYPSETQNTDNNSYTKVDEFRQEIIAHHTENGFGNPADIKSQDRLPQVSVELPEDPIPIVTAPPLSPDLNIENANSLQQSDSNIQMTTTYLAFFILVAVISTFFLVLRVARRRRSTRQRQEIYQYLSGFDIEDIDIRRAITGGWHGQYKNNLAVGVEGDSDFDTFSDSDDGSGSYDLGTDDRTIVFLEQGDLSSPISSRKRPLPFTMLVADRNVYLDESTNGAESDDDDIFAPVRTRPF